LKIRFTFDALTAIKLNGYANHRLLPICPSRHRVNTSMVLVDSIPAVNSLEKQIRNNFRK